MISWAYCWSRSKYLKDEPHRGLFVTGPCDVLVLAIIHDIVIALA